MLRYQTFGARLNRLLADAKDDKFGGLRRSDPNLAVESAGIDVVLGHRHPITLDGKGIV